MQSIQTGVDASGLRFMRNAVCGRDFLLVVLHGLGKCMAHVFDLFLECDPQLPLVAVQAPHRLGPGAYRWFGYRPGSNTEMLEEEWQASARQLEAFLRNLAHANGGCALRLAGHSQGAMMALDAAVALPRRVRHCACISGRLLPQTAARLALAEPAALAGQRFLIVHGSEDTVVPLPKGVDARDRLRGTAAHVDFATLRAGHELDAAMVREVVPWLAGRPGAPRPSA